MLKQKLTLLVVPDDVVIDLVNERLSKPDCRLNGWILDGCPFNIKQIQLLRDLKIEPQKVIALEISDEAVLRELSRNFRKATLFSVKNYFSNPCIFYQLVFY